MKAVDLNALHTLVCPAIEAQGYELVDLEWKRAQGGWVFRIIIDRPPGEGYVSHKDCVGVSREVSALLDVHDVLPVHYNLEVSSPGVDRPLKQLRDFQRFLGKAARVRLKEVAARPQPEGAPRRNFQGRIAAAEDGRVRLQLENDLAVDLRVDEIEKANLVYEP